MVSPPRDRPSASRLDFLSFGAAPCGVIGGPDTAGPGRMPMGPGHGRVHAHRPVPALGRITARPQPVQDLLPRPVQRPAAMPPVDASSADGPLAVPHCRWAADPPGDLGADLGTCRPSGRPRASLRIGR